MRNTRHLIVKPSTVLNEKKVIPSKERMAWNVKIGQKQRAVLYQGATRISFSRHNSADSVPTSNLVYIKEVAIRTTFCIAGLIYYICYLDTDI